MRALILVTLLTLIAGCTTLRPVEMPPDQLQHLIVSERLLGPGDRVRLVTADDTEHRFRVVAVDVEGGWIVGENESVRIADVVAVETREFSKGKTAALAGGVIATWVIILILIAPAAILAAGA
jgi:hypothetical protein